jgi:hypothetical protein
MPYEAWLHGVVTAQVKPELHELLSGLASEPSAEVQDLFLCMASPPNSDVPRSEVLIQRDIKRGTWCVRSVLGFSKFWLSNPSLSVLRRLLRIVFSTGLCGIKLGH